MLEAGIRQFTAWGNTDPGRHVLADNDPAFRRGNFCSVICGSAWSADDPRVKRITAQGSAILWAATPMLDNWSASVTRHFILCDG
jgi:hypothetical protein